MIITSKQTCERTYVKLRPGIAARVSQMDSENENCDLSDFCDVIPPQRFAGLVVQSLGRYVVKEDAVIFLNEVETGGSVGRHVGQHRHDHDEQVLQEIRVLHYPSVSFARSKFDEVSVEL